MKSVKPGRGPSAMGVIVGSLVAVFGIIWTIAALTNGAPWFFALFGLVFVIAAVANVFYHAHNATSENRYSEFDIMDDTEEPDPLNRRFHHQQGAETFDARMPKHASSAGRAYCPYCGAKVNEDYTFCEQCGKRLP